MDSPREEWVTLDAQSMSGLAALQTIKSSERLNQIDRVRAKGVGDHISLPQLVVCGDQSAGKSSVLERLTGIPFPRADGVCTKFATEIILRHQPDKHQITAKLMPSGQRTEDERHRMKSFERQLKGFDDLPCVIHEAADVMGIQENSPDSGSNCPTFAADVLRLEFVGNTGLHLTVVDLPGLISVSEKSEDMQIVADLVDGYLKSSRTIILAVVQASIDIDTQGIIQRARRFDQAGERTVGIITKPDLINEGTEDRVAGLAKNMANIKLKLGFFLLKNPSPRQLQDGMGWAERVKEEASFFASTKWNKQNLDKSRIGIERLRCFLQELLDSHIERELPKVRNEIEALLLHTETLLARIGPERSSVAQIRMFLMQTSLQVYSLIKAALDGDYSGRDATFFITKAGSIARLRSKIHTENESFAAYMRRFAAKRNIREAKKPTKKTLRSSKELPVPSQSPMNSDDSQGCDLSTDRNQLQVTRKEMLKWIETVYHNTRGLELPGNYNKVLLSELYYEHSSRWEEIAKDHLKTVVSLINRFIRSVLAHVIMDEHVRSGIQYGVQKVLELNIKSAKQELDKLVSDEQRQPITYNHYFTDNVQKARQDNAKKQVEDSLCQAIEHDSSGKPRVGKTPVDLQRLTSCLDNRIIVDMTEQACVESLIALDAYYKVAMKTFVDNVCRQVIERHLLSGLTKVFDPVSVSQLSEEEICKIACETAKVHERRIELQALKEALEESLRELRD